MSDADTVVRPYHEDDVPKLVALFQRVFDKPLTSDHWRWKLQGNPPPACNVWVAETNGSPVFQYAGIAQRYTLSALDAVGFVSVDTMTDPDFRRRGLLTRVASRAYEAWREAGAAFVIGLPNEQWGSRAQALGWRELFPLRWYARPLRPHRWIARKARLPLLRVLAPLESPWNAFFDARIAADPGVEIAEVARADAEFDELWRSIRGRYAFAAVRDAAWVNWRFLESPRGYEVIAARRGGRLLGYAAWRATRADTHVSAHLADLFVAPGDSRTRNTLVRAIVARARGLGAELLLSLAIPGTESARALRHAGFFEGAGFTVQVVLLANPPAVEELRNPSKWFMTGADYDVI